MLITVMDAQYHGLHKKSYSIIQTFDEQNAKMIVIKVVSVLLELSTIHKIYKEFKILI